MPTPAHYSRLAAFVARHRWYYLGVGFGGFLVLFGLAALLAALQIPLPPYFDIVFYWVAFLVGCHWPFIIAAFWFHPSRGVLNLPIGSPLYRTPLARALLAWILSMFLNLFFLGAFLGPPLVYFSPMLVGAQ